jgi:hypothetical protein
MTEIVISPGDQVNLDFKNIKDGNGVPFNPTTVKWHIKAPGVDVVTVTHPATGSSKIDDGWYRYTVNVPYAQTAVGWWKCDAQGLDSDGNSLLVEPNSFEVVASGTLASS